MTGDQDKAKWSISIKPNTSASGKKENKTEEESSSFPMPTFMMENGKTEKCTGQDSMSQMV